MRYIFSPQGEAAMSRFVITSYSIHYTKLYEIVIGVRAASGKGTMGASVPSKSKASRVFRRMKRLIAASPCGEKM